MLNFIQTKTEMILNTGISLILNSSSAQLASTMPFMLVHAGKYRTEDKLKLQTIHKLNTSQKKQTAQTRVKNFTSPVSGLVTFHYTRPGNRVGLFYNTPEPTR